MPQQKLNPDIVFPSPASVPCSPSILAILAKARLQPGVVACAEKFKREYPQVGINLVVENTRRCCQAVARGELDFAVVGGQIPPDVKHLLLVSAIQLLSWCLLMYGPAHCVHLLACSLSSLHAVLGFAYFAYSSRSP